LAIELLRPVAAKLLIHRRADVNIADRELRTPLHAAIESAQTSVVEALADAGVDISLKNKSGKTASDIAPPAMKALLGKAQQGTSKFTCDMKPGCY
jgi:ankyrin repeat protein